MVEGQQQKPVQHAKGMVTINSTSGLQGLYHKLPVMPLGKCCYDIPGLTYQGELKSFWDDPGVVDYELYKRYRTYLIHHTQLNVSFYRKMPALDQVMRERIKSRFQEVLRLNY